MNYSELKDFRHFPTSQQHLEIKDEYGQLLAYRFRVPTEFADHLENSTSTLPPTKTHLERKINPRGTFPIRHYATWADFSTDIFYSGDYKKDLPYSAEWIQSNKSLWKYVGDRLKLISPESYSTAINQDMTPNSTLQHHQDWRDIRSTPNAVIAWVKVELKKGDCLLFWGSLIAHGNDEITEGTRHSVNMFTHKSNIDWIKRDPQNRYLKIGGQNKLPVTSKVEKDGKNKKKLKDGQDRGEGGSKKFFNPMEKLSGPISHCTYTPSVLSHISWYLSGSPSNLQGIFLGTVIYNAESY
ncbi:hypothetical protein DFH27DRAFT_527928 [Peziza echinospora]|nr:hypothetical protein DFH27DRAFT_527928 [Peziza echinospora]